jgi:pantetheine-phosphate adenylyltransferase
MPWRHNCPKAIPRFAPAGKFGLDLLIGSKFGSIEITSTQIVCFRDDGYNSSGVNTVKAIYPGSFDPVTNGHLDLIARGSKIFDHLVVSILQNSSKNPLFTVEERVEMLSEALAGLDNVSVATFDGLLVDFVREQHAQAVMRGIRAISDYEYELQMALMNRRLAPELETIFLMPDGKYSFVSSRLVKEVFTLGGSIEGLVPQFVIDRLKARMPNGHS